MAKDTTAALVTHAQQFVTGGAARVLAQNGFQTNALRTNDLLRKDEWEELDAVLVGIARQRLIGINDLRNAGLVLNLGGLGTLLSQYEKLADMTDADVDLAGVTQGERDSVTFTLVSVPVPITHKDFSINIRRLEASRKLGAPIDTTQTAVATEKVVEKLEDLLFSGFTGGNLDGNPLYGYTNHPDRNTHGGSDWGTVTNASADAIASLALLEADSYFGDGVLYAATTQFGQLRTYHTDGSGDTEMDRVAGIPGIGSVRPGDRLTDGQAVLVMMRKDVVDLAVGQELTVVEWETLGGMTMNFKVMAAISPRVKSDAAGGSGVVHLTGI